MAPRRQLTRDVHLDDDAVTQQRLERIEEFIDSGAARDAHVDARFDALAEQFAAVTQQQTQHRPNPHYTAQPNLHFVDISTRLATALRTATTRPTTIRPVMARYGSEQRRGWNNNVSLCRDTNRNSNHLL